MELAACSFIDLPIPCLVVYPLFGIIRARVRDEIRDYPLKGFDHSPDAMMRSMSTDHPSTGATFYKTNIPKDGDEFVAISIAEGFEVRVLRGRYRGEGKKGEVLKRKTRKFPTWQDAEKEFKRECDAAQKDFPFPKYAHGNVLSAIREWDESRAAPEDDE